MLRTRLFICCSYRDKQQPSLNPTSDDLIPLWRSRCGGGGKVQLVAKLWAYGEWEGGLRGERENLEASMEITTSPRKTPPNLNPKLQHHVLMSS